MKIVEKVLGFFRKIYGFKKWDFIQDIPGGRWFNFFDPKDELKYIIRPKFIPTNNIYGKEIYYIEINKENIMEAFVECVGNFLYLGIDRNDISLYLHPQTYLDLQCTMATSSYLYITLIEKMIKNYGKQLKIIQDFNININELKIEYEKQGIILRGIIRIV